MSGTTTTTTTPDLPDRLTEYGKLVTSVLFGGAFICALIYAYIAKDQDSKELLVGAVISNANTVVQFFLGSSSGSQKKDDNLAIAAAAGVAVAPKLPVPPLAVP